MIDALYPGHLRMIQNIQSIFTLLTRNSCKIIAWGCPSLSSIKTQNSRVSINKYYFINSFLLLGLVCSPEQCQFLQIHIIPKTFCIWYQDSKHKLFLRKHSNALCSSLKVYCTHKPSYGNFQRLSFSY